MSRFFCTLFVLGVVSAAVAPASATTWYVDPQGGGNFRTIGQALAASSNGDLILLADGLYQGSGNQDLDFGGRAVTVRSDLGVPQNCIIDCGGSQGSPHRAFNFQTGEGPASILAGLTISNGYTLQETTTRLGGGAIMIRDASPTFQNCRFVDNTSEGMGGAVMIGEGTPRFEGCTFLNNVGMSGGAIATRDLDNQDETGEVDIITCQFEGNSAASSLTIPLARLGGAICGDGRSISTSPRVLTHATFVMQDCQFISNSAQKMGGAASFFGVSASFLGSTTAFTNNSAVAGGGAVVCFGPVLHFEEATFTENRAGTYPAPDCPEGDPWGIPGGAIAFYSSAPAFEDPDPDEYSWTVADCLFEQNYSEGGGGAISLNDDTFDMQNYADLTISKNQFIGNVARMFGGGVDVFLHGNDGSPCVGSVMVLDNIFDSNEARPPLPYYTGYRSAGGGGLRFYGAGVQDGFERVIRGNEFVNNISNGPGGAISLEDKNNVVIENNYIHGNTAEVNVSSEIIEQYCPCPILYCDTYYPRWDVARGGGIHATGCGGMVLRGNRIVGNQCVGLAGAVGGGVELRMQRYQDQGVWVGDRWTVENNLIAGNSATDEGGGLHVEIWDEFPEEAADLGDGQRSEQDAMLQCQNNTFVCNEARQGGGVFLYGEPIEGYFENNIVYGNTSTELAGGIAASDPITPARYRYNDVNNNTGGNWGGTFPASQWYSYNNTNVSPQFMGAWSCPGGPTTFEDVSLAAGSVCRNGGNPTLIYNDCNGSRNDMGLFGGNALCEHAEYVASFIRSALPGCVLHYTWTTNMATAVDHLYYRMNGETEWSEGDLIQHNGTTHVAEIPVFESMHPYTVRIAADAPEGVWYQYPEADGFKLYCFLPPKTLAGPTGQIEGARIEFEMAAAGPANLTIFDVTGRAVRHLELGSMSAGSHSVGWDGRSDDGSTVRSGVYFHLVDTPGGVVRGRVVLVR